jgi:hypothetical protein
MTKTFVPPRVRLTVLAVLIASALSVALTVYFYSSNSETDQFEEHFQDNVDKVFDSYLRRIDRTLGIANSFVLGKLPATASITESKWWASTAPDNVEALLYNVSKLSTATDGSWLAIHGNRVFDGTVFISKMQARRIIWYVPPAWRRPNSLV